ncbi:immunoglobulin-like domain-containing protein [Stigmatella aurantiaca]|uniref:immunoglobulin-like domain-containing protein n=1 Tax=Stigmatella aurantiaca TaxID=41 RepID=UPI001FEAA7B9|nr:immunoglobulin-like domain-containing protein [Stigmatella aurantiaca]
MLILGTTVTGGASSREAQAAANLGYPATVVTPEQWRAMTPEQFQQYAGIIIGDAACQGGESAFQAAVDNRNIWGAAVDGDVVISGSDATNNGTPQFIENIVSSIVSKQIDSRTGMYISLGCAYQDAAPGTPVPLLEPFGSFTVAGTGCYANGGHIFRMYPGTLSDGLYGNDGALNGTGGCTTRVVFSSYPDKTFAPVAIAVDESYSLPGAREYWDYLMEDPDNAKNFIGTPYILTQGAMAFTSGCGQGSEPTAMCDLSPEGNGKPATPGYPADGTCSFSCQQQWCGDGHVDGEQGEECDEGYFNGRTRDASGTIGACTAFCKIPTLDTESPPEALCKNLELVADLTCGADGNVNNGSWDPDENLVGCRQSPIGPYGPGTTTVTLTCMDTEGNTDSCTATITVLDQNKPTLTLVGNNEHLECAPGTYADPGATAADVCEGDLTGKIAASGTVNPGAVGQYELTYNVEDSSGNAATPVKRTVAVSDTKAPTLALKGLANDIAECASPYADPGATASDVCAGNLDAAITQTGSVDTAALGTYAVKYNVQDPEGNKAPEISRIVQVKDTLKPVVTVNGPLTQKFECGSGEFNDEGATANDACAGALATDQNAVVNPNQPGAVTITYSATDPSGNTGVSATGRTVTVEDTLPPTLTLAPGPQGLECGDAYTDPGATANDQCAGNLTASIQKTGSINNKQLGAQKLTYKVSDASGHSITADRTVTVSDSLKPVVTVTGELNAKIECGSGPFNDPGATANDACEGVLPAVPNETVDPSVPGAVTVSYKATDSSGNVGVSATGRTVTVEDTLAPTLALKPGASTLECGNPYADPGATANDQCYGDLTGAIQKTGSINPKQLGDQSLTYTVQDPGGRTAGPVTRTVKVNDTLAPALTVQGPANQTFECGSAYVDPGATANDACEDDLTGEIVSTRTPVPGQPGAFTISYSVKDSSGNEASAPAARTVKSDDNTPPVLALQGPAVQALECATPYADPGAIASDVCTDDINDRITVTGTVNPNVPNSYTVTYNVTDIAGLSAPAVTRQVNVSDTQKPVVTVTGPGAVNIECGGDGFNDPGATANDACAGVLPAVPSTVVNPNQPGAVTVTYSATDPSGNTGTSATGRTVNVQDTLPPTLALKPGASTLECASPYVDPGATANDQCAGDLSNAIVTTGTVNNKQLGSHVLGYSVTDPSGRTASASRTVDVSDTLAPVINVTGPLETTFECGSPYVDQGATAEDACAGAVPVTSNQVGDTSSPGSFIISYSAQDPSGNSVTAPVTRKVTVNDNEPPTLALRGAATEALECGNPYADPGAVASDVCFGDVTNRITVEGTINNKLLAAQTLTYKVTDPAGQSAPPVTRTVNVGDSLAPVITVTGPLAATIECGGGSFNDPGATADDKCIGPVPAVPTAVVNPGAEGTYSIKYMAQDTSGNSAISDASRIVTVADTLPPTLALNGPAAVGLECATPFADPGATANDQCAGDVSNRIQTSGTIDNKQLTAQTITYSVTDLGGRAAAPVSRTVTVSDTLAPTLALNGGATETFECGADYVDPGATANDLCAGQVSDRVVPVRTQVPGGFTITYSVTDPSGNSAAAPVTRTVKSADNTPPVLALNGPTNLALECGNPFTDPGAVAEDVCDDNLNITVTGTVNPAVPADYTLTYNVTDSAANAATPVTRTVSVQDTQAPTLALNGPATVGLECATPFNDPGATANDLCAGDLSDTVVRTGTLNEGAVGNYTLTYTVADSGGHTAAPVSRTVAVNDTLKPVVTVNGPATLAVECGDDGFNDPGATADDACAGTLPAVPSNTVNPNVPGAVTITYSATDPSGNVGVGNTGRTVTVEDTLAPELALVGPANQPLECGTPYNDPGATANDQCAGDLTGAIQATGNINNKQLGAQTVTYTVQDPGGRTAAPVSRTVTVGDTLVPAITVNGPLDQAFECGSTYVDPGATANDLCADDLTANIVATRTPIAGQPGSFTISYSVTDPSGNTATSANSRTVRVEDNTPPMLALTGPATQALECGSPYVDPGATALDACVGDLTGAITRSGEVNPNVPNTYTVIYNVSDPSGQSAPPVSRQVNVSDTLPPVLALNGPATLGLECATPFIDPGATANDQCVGNLNDAIVTTGTVNTMQLGNHVLGYSVTDPSGLTASATRTVGVSDTQAPVITLKGPLSDTYECGGQYIDPGATAADACAGDLTGHIVATRSPVPGQPGSFTITYSVQDPSGNKAVAPVTRIVREGGIQVRLSDFNVFLFEDYTLGSDVEGRVAAGGNISMKHFSVGWELPSSDTAPVLVAGGNLSLTQGGVWGDAAYGGTYSASNVTYVRGAPSKSTPVDFPTRSAEVRKLSTQLDSLPTNGLTRRETWGGLMLTGSSQDVNVFSVNASDLSSTVLLSIDAPSGSLAVLNIHGTSAKLAGGHVFSGGIDQQGVLFNFVDATSINAQGYGLWGTLLAPNAHVNFTNGSFDGGIYAKSLSGNAEGHLNPLRERVICNGPSFIAQLGRQ